jgi:hypothetical protein
MVANSVFLRFSEVPERTHTVPLPFSWRTRRAYGWGWWRDPRVCRWRWPFKRFWPSKTQIFVHLGRGTPQQRLRNGWRNGRVSTKVTANASPRGVQRSWGVALPSDQASRRSSPARARVPPGLFSPTLYLKKGKAGKPEVEQKPYIPHYSSKNPFPERPKFQGDTAVAGLNPTFCNNKKKRPLLVCFET